MNAAGLKIVVASLAIMLTLTGCHKKKQATLPAQSQAPAVETPKQPAPAAKAPEEPSTAGAGTTASTTTAPVEPTITSAETTTKTKPKPRKPRNHTKPATASNSTSPATATPPANNAPSQTAKVVVPQGGETVPGQISAAGPDDDALSRKEIEQLLQSTDTNLRSINRQLNDNERAMVEQIKTYMAQARTASTDGDLMRANKLALKAHLLSDELVKR